MPAETRQNAHRDPPKSLEGQRIPDRTKDFRIKKEFNKKAYADGRKQRTQRQQAGTPTAGKPESETRMEGNGREKSVGEVPGFVGKRTRTIRLIPSMWTCHKQSSTVMARHGAQYGLHFDASRKCDRHKLSLTVATAPAPHCGRNTGCVLTGRVLGPSSRERPSGSRTAVRVTDGYEKSPRPA